MMTWIRLNRHDMTNIGSNSEIVCVLLDFKANHLAESSRAALDADCVDTGVCGDWDEIRAGLN